MRQPVGVVFADEQPALLNGGRNRASAFQSLGKRSKLANGGGPPPAVMKGANGKALNGHGGNKQQQPEVVYPPSSGPPPTKGIMKSSRNSNNQQREKEKAQCPHGFQLDLGIIYAISYDFTLFRVPKKLMNDVLLIYIFVRLNIALQQFIDFVKFAEDVATGREQIQKWSSPSKRARHIMASPVPSFASPNHLNTTNSDCCPDSSLDDRLNNSSSIMLDSSILSKSMDEPTSELEEILNHPRELVQHDATPPPHRSSSNSNNNNNLQQQQQSRKQWGGRVPQSILKHSSNNNSESPFVPIPAPPQSIISSSYSHFQQQQQPHQSNSSHSRQQQQHQYHQPRGYIDSSQTTPRRYTTLSSAAGRGHSMDAHLASATLPYPPPSRKDCVFLSLCCGFFCFALLPYLCCHVKICDT